MKLVKIIIRPERFGFVKYGLEENGFYGMTITAVEGQGEQKRISPEPCKGLKAFDLHPKIQIEIVVDYDRVDYLISTIAESCRNENISDCRIYIIPVEKTIRILKGEVLEESPVGGTFGIAAPASSEHIPVGECDENGTCCE